ncbi:MAG: MOSC domain-containing protein [Beijerinckiaceae bacterium]
MSDAMRFFSSVRIKGRVAGLYQTPTTQRFQTAPVDSISLGFDGIAGDRHAGLTRKSGGREPWYPRGTEIRNERQLSLLSPHDLAAIAAGMDIAEVRPEWIGGNVLIEGIPDFTLLPARTCLFFEGGVTLRIDGLNVPCRFSGRSIAQHYPERQGLDLAFTKAARHARGLVGWVEKPGVIHLGEAVEARVPEQWIYTNGQND